MEKQTPLYETHRALGARMAPFGGFTMPIQYQGIFTEHEATRKHATLFDTCHMGEFHLSGATAVDDLERLVSCSVTGLEQGQCRYGMLCNEGGGVIDDLLVYRLGDTAFMLVVNAGTQHGDAEWIQAHLSPTTAFENRSADTAKIDLQGPSAPPIMETIVEGGIMDLRFYRFKESTYRGTPVIVSRTGYTGEVGFEIYLPCALAETFWRDAMERGATCAGLGARDTLRLEMGMPLYGHELDATRNAGQSGFTHALAADKTFIGHRAIFGPGAQAQRLVGIRLDGRQAARQGDAIVSLSGEEIGSVTSGSFAPSLGRAVALGYVVGGHAIHGGKVALRTRRKTLAGAFTPPPFYHDATGRKSLSLFCG